MKKRLLRWLISYLAFCAKMVLKRTSEDVVVVGVTGSTGKTSTKEAIGLVASHIWRNKTIVSPGNLNNEIGLPLSILGYQDVPKLWQYPILFVSALLRAFFLQPADCYVLEYAIDSPGDMDYLTSIVSPTWTVVTNITTVHLENFKKHSDLVGEKYKLVQATKNNGYVIVNGDDKYLSSKIKKSRKYTLALFGRENINDVRISNIQLLNNMTKFDLRLGGITNQYKINALGVHYAYALIPAIVFGINNHLSPETIQRVISDFKPLPGRGNIVHAINNSTIINDTYNANPLSVQAGLMLLKQLPSGNKIAVLGDMLELGSESDKEHRHILKIASRIADVVITVGPKMRLAGGGNINFKSPLEVAKYLKNNMDRNSLILVKGSQSMRMEIVVKYIMANPENAANELPRQTKSWLKKPFIGV